MRLQSVIGVLLFFVSAGFSHGAVVCIGPKDASRFMVYLHGMDTISPSKQELENRKVLSRLAESLKIKFAIPRAKSKCPTNSAQLCWSWQAKISTDLESTKNAISTSANECFPSKGYEVLGFSNGGAALTSMLRLCEKVEFKKAIAIGAAGGWFSSDPKDLRSCGPKLISMLGKEDGANQKPVRDLTAHLLSLHAPIELVEYVGGHALSYEPLYEVLK